LLTINCRVPDGTSRDRGKLARLQLRYVDQGCIDALFKVPDHTVTVAISQMRQELRLLSRHPGISLFPNRIPMAARISAAQDKTTRASYNRDGGD
jgi:hypothetical protein